MTNGSISRGEIPTDRFSLLLKKFVGAARPHEVHTEQDFDLGMRSGRPVNTASRVEHLPWVKQFLTQKTVLDFSDLSPDPPSVEQLISIGELLKASADLGRPKFEKSRYFSGTKLEPSLRRLFVLNIAGMNRARANELREVLSGCNHPILVFLARDLRESENTTDKEWARQVSNAIDRFRRNGPTPVVTPEAKSILKALVMSQFVTKAPRTETANPFRDGSSVFTKQSPLSQLERSHKAYLAAFLFEESPSAETVKLLEELRRKSVG